MIKLILIDVDGTLHGPDGVPPCAWEAADRARAAGIRLSLATGRPNTGISVEYARKLDPKGYHIFHQGAVVASADGELLFSTPFPQIAYHALVDLSRELGAPLESYTADGGFYVERTSTDLASHANLLQVETERADLHFVLQTGTVVRLQWVIRQGKVWSELRTRIDENFSTSLSWHIGTSPATPGLIYASQLRSDAGKLNAARWLAKKMGIDFSQVAAIGDGENDLELLRAAGVGIAMGNAPDAVKQAADRVVSPVEDCGLAEALEGLWRER